MNPTSSISSRWYSSVSLVSRNLQLTVAGVLTNITVVAKGTLMLYCFHYRRFPSVHVFFIDHRNDIVVNIFGLVMFVVGDRFVWYLDPIGAMLIALLILFSWAANAFEQVWLLVGLSAPKEFIAKLIYMCMTHDERILKVDTVGTLCRFPTLPTQLTVEIVPRIPCWPELLRRS